MLRLAEPDDCRTDEELTASAAARADAVAAPFESGGRYGEQRRVSPAAVAAVIAAHVGAFLLGMYFQPQIQRQHDLRLKVVEVRFNTPPPPPDQKPIEQPKAAKLETRPVAPPPAVPLAIAARVPAEIGPKPVVIAPPQPPAPPAPPAPAAPPAMVEGGDIGTRMISAKPPRYPMSARRKREQGTVVLSVTLGLDGRVTGVAIARSSGFASLDDAARDAVRHWRWAPTLRDGEPVMVRGVVEIPFVLHG